MIETPKIIALVPMRHISERVPGKNYRLFAGKPLYTRILDTLLKCPEISEIIVDTDSPIILEGVKEYYPEKIIGIERPKHLREGNIPMNDIILNDIKQFEADFYLQTHSTNPMLKAETISKGIKLFLKANGTYDSLFSVTALRTRLWDELTRPVNHNANILLRTQDLPPLYEENSCMYLFSKNILQETHNRIGYRPLMFEMDALESVDIDEEFDFKIAELLFLERERK